ncbi:MAG: histidine phosphatase family protein [Burkholderiaceae bacterium]|nr:histidine phosphatase family protein [Burkholderiaceae bacterium]
MTPRRLWTARHAQPLVAPGHCYGALDVPADAAATAHSAEQLAQALPQGIRAYHSPLQRCEQLAQALQRLRPDLVLQTDPRLAEMNFGAWEGRSWDNIGRAPIDAWTADFANHRPGGGENLATVLARVAAALADARQSAAPADVLWITHAGVARCVQWLLQSPPGVAPRADQWPVAAPALGAWTVFALPNEPKIKSTQRLQHKG